MLQNERLPDAALEALMSSGADVRFLREQGEPLSLDLLFPGADREEMVFPGDRGRGRDGAGGSEPLTTASTEGDPDGDDDGDGIPNKDDPDSEVEVIGRRPRVYDPNIGDDTGGGDSGGGGTFEPHQHPNDCRDRNASAGRDKINDQPDALGKEHASVVYRGADGAVHHSPPIEGIGDYIDPAVIFKWMGDNGVSFAQVLALVHSHPQQLYGDINTAEGKVNRYPSGGAVAGGDWNTASYMVANGAGGPGGEGFALYIIDAKGELREFEFHDREKYMSLTEAERERGKDLPPETEDDGGTC